MAIKIMFTLVLSFLTSTLIYLSAQDTTSNIKCNDIIRLKSGLVVKCNILDFDEKGTFIEKKNQDTLYILNEDHKIIHQNGASKIIKETDKKLYEKKWITSIDAGIAVGYSKEYIISGTVVDIGISTHLDKKFNHSLRGSLSFVSTHFGVDYDINYAEIINLNLGYQYNFNKGTKVPFVFFDLGKNLKKNILSNAFFHEPDLLSFQGGLGLEFKKQTYSYRVSANYFYWNFNNASFASGGRSLEDFPITRLLLKFGISM
jgi:hypothetical protein